MLKAIIFKGFKDDVQRELNSFFQGSNLVIDKIRIAQSSAGARGIRFTIIYEE
ncbi:MAG: hypothetical protein JXA99_08500 [Candidatus Lokiarchaeota archaeon]|nr:hypothetical protein [Candidatus Lokiarchaeota archaeon]